MNDLFGGDERYQALLERVEALEALVYQQAKQERVKADEPLNEAWQLWNRHRNGKGWTAKARELSMKKLRELAGTDGQLAMQIVCQSIERGWTGLFPLRDTTAATGIHQSRPEPVQRHKTVAEAFTPSESRDANHAAWIAQQRAYGLIE
jgi:hypothetical protein